MIINFVYITTSNSDHEHKILYTLQPPIQVFGMEGRYATALFSAASKQKSLDAVEKDLVKFQVIKNKSFCFDKFESFFLIKIVINFFRVS